MALPTFPLPLLSGAPPEGYGWGARATSTVSATTAFGTGIDQRDVFLGRHRCVICGFSSRLEHCHIISQSEPKTWSLLKEKGWLPSEAKSHPQHEPRNGLLMCPNHHSAFDAYEFFIRFVPETGRFVLVNYCGHPDYRHLHGKSIALDITHHYAPFPAIFIIHELRVRGFHPFQPIQAIAMPSYPWQDWITLENILSNGSGKGLFRQDLSPDDSEDLTQAPLSNSFDSQTLIGADAAPHHTDHESSVALPALSADVIGEILAATRAMPSWKACRIEGTDWSGTAKDNIEKYKRIMSGYDEGIQTPASNGP